jgi:hypothetical protein
MTFLDYCKPCHKYFENTYLLQCECGVKMCKQCWLEFDYICPICEVDHNPTSDEEAHAKARPAGLCYLIQ